MPSIVLGCIADDFTGATDLANNLVRAGMRVVQTIGVPNESLQSDVDAVVVALKSRTIAPALAVEQSLLALKWLRAEGAQQIYFKYCSTFDSWYEGDVRGNIGPVTDALMDALNTDFTIATPAFPDNHRTVCNGYLFVGDVLLSESSMKDHPLTPMLDANLVRVLQAQSQKKVGLIAHTVMAKGHTAITQRINELKTQGVQIAVVDALNNDDLIRLGPALKNRPLVTASSGVAIGLPANWNLMPNAQSSLLPSAKGFQAIVSGSCSQATQAQVAHFKQSGQPAFEIDVMQLHTEQAKQVQIEKALQWAQSLVSQKAVLIYSTADPARVQEVQKRWDVEASGAMIEQTLAQITQGLVRLGVSQLLVAGGETSGACVQALQVGQLQIGLQIDPGVPWCYAHSSLSASQGLHISLKSGNFGTVDFFTKAWRMLS
ncbi:MAG: four-carbon acid sugar kinase family protein [Limnohabitans sp.]|nr:four-carbon acid sugar kinase family protein [Limnohabitans sp.]